MEIKKDVDEIMKEWTSMIVKTRLTSVGAVRRAMKKSSQKSIVHQSL